MDTPHPARMHDYWLGGGRNTAADRDLAEKITKVLPGIEEVARLSQAFLHRAVLHMVDSGVHQFLDIGSGIPMVGELNRLVRRVDAGSVMVHVDSDPVSRALSELSLAGVGGAGVLDGDMRDVAGILDADVTRRLLDLRRPVCLIAPTMHFVPDSWDPAGLLASYRDRLAPGSGLVLLHVTADAEPPGLLEAIELYGATQLRAYPRSRAEIMRMCAGFDLVEPGLVGYADWRPDDSRAAAGEPALGNLLYAAVGRKP